MDPQDPNTTNPQGEGQPAQQQGQPPEAKSFTQDEVNTILAKQKRDARAEGIRLLEQELGVPFETLKTQIKPASQPAQQPVTPPAPTHASEDMPAWAKAWTQQVQQQLSSVTESITAAKRAEREGYIEKTAKAKGILPQLMALINQNAENIDAEIDRIVAAQTEILGQSGEKKTPPATHGGDRTSKREAPDEPMSVEQAKQVERRVGGLS